MAIFNSYFDITRGYGVSSLGANLEPSIGTIHDLDSSSSWLVGAILWGHGYWSWSNSHLLLTKWTKRTGENLSWPLQESWKGPGVAKSSDISVYIYTYIWTPKTKKNAIVLNCSTFLRSALHRTQLSWCFFSIILPSKLWCSKSNMLKMMLPATLWYGHCSWIPKTCLTDFNRLFFPLVTILHGESRGFSQLDDWNHRSQRNPA